MEFSTAIPDQFARRAEIASDSFSFFEALKDFGTNVRTATNSDGVAQDVSSLLDSVDFFLLPCRHPIRRVTASGQRTSANQRARPRAKILGAKPFTHYFADVVVDVLPRYIYKLAVAILVFENFVRAMLEQASHDFRDLVVLQVKRLLHA